MIRFNVKNTLAVVIIAFMVGYLPYAYCAEGHTRMWSVVNILESFQNNKKLKYYFQPEVRLIDNAYVFNQLFILLGWGYQVAPNVLILAGPGWILIKDFQGNMIHEYRLWEQINWNVLPDHPMNLVSRTRLEEQVRDTNRQLSVVLRERMLGRIPIKNWENHFVTVFDEVFFNLNQPKWVAPHFFSQNRAFVGLGIQMSKNTFIDVGYLNQYQRTNPIQMSNVLWFSLTVND